ncbi:hypothetical protein [Streptomyces rishiriensis]|uniref:Uncharacterized protein n=1 Tax=Streptomyces rishiriensis TaxID=68264 RepID=A0ABU0NFR4_STRRH|nr:hypothetical protein [Streptomyces rishiriensis]
MPRRVEPAEALGKLADDDHLVRVQLLVTCASNTEGRARPGSPNSRRFERRWNLRHCQPPRTTGSGWKS